MSKWNYVASAYKSSVVTCSLVARFTELAVSNLVIAKSNRIELHKLTHEGIIPIQEISLYGIILSLVKIEGPSGLDWLLAITEPYTLSLICYESSNIRILECSDIRESRQSKTDYIPIIAEDQHKRAVCLHMYKGLIRILTLRQPADLSTQFLCRLEEECMLDMCFLDDPSELSLAILYQKNMQFIVDFYHMNLTERRTECLQGRSITMNVSCSKLIPMLCGLTGVVSTTGLSVYSTVLVSNKLFSFGNATAVERVDHTRWVVGNESGELMLVHAPTGGELCLSLLGETSVACSITYLDSNYLFIGSRSGDSAVVKVLEDSSLLVEQTFPNIGPILDFTVLHSDRGGISSLISCSGYEQDGTIRLISKGISAVEENKLDGIQATGLWSVKTAGEFFSHLIISNMDQTTVMEMTECTLAPREYPDFLSAPSVCVQQTPLGILQVTRHCISLLDFTWGGVFKHEFPSGFCTHASVYEDRLVVVLNGDEIVSYLISPTELCEQSRLPTTEEIACITVYKELVAVGMWVEMSVAVYSFTELHLVWKEQLREDILPRSVLFETLEETQYLFVGLADGHLISYSLPAFDRKSSILGTKAVHLTSFKYQNKNYIFAACDQPVVVYSMHARLFYAAVNTEAVLMMAPFQTALYPDCLALISDDCLLMVSIDEIQRFSSWSYPVKQSLRRIHALDDSYVCIGVDKGLNSKVFVVCSDELQIKNSVLLPSCEFISAMVVVKQFVYIGTVTYADSSTDPVSGKIYIYKCVEQDFQLISCVQTDREVTVLCALGSTHMVGGLKGEVVFWKICADYSLLELSRPDKMHYILCVDTYENYVAVADIMKSLKVYEADGDSLILRSRTYQILWPTTIKLISKELLLVGDSFGTLLLFGLSAATALTMIGGFFLGENINCFRKGSFIHGASDELLGEVECVLFGTTKGCIGVIASLREKDYVILRNLQRSLTEMVPYKDGMNLYNFRKPGLEGENIQWDNFIDGDFVERFLNMHPSEQMLACNDVNRDLNLQLNVQDLQKLVLSLSKIH